MNSPANYIDPNGTVPWSWQRNGETAVQYSMRMYNQDMYDMMYSDGGGGSGGGGGFGGTPGSSDGYWKTVTAQGYSYGFYNEELVITLRDQTYETKIWVPYEAQATGNGDNSDWQLIPNPKGWEGEDMSTMLRIKIHIQRYESSFDGRTGGDAPKPIKFIANLNPLFSVPNAFKTIITGEDFAGVKASNGQRWIAAPFSIIISVVPGVGSYLKMDDGTLILLGPIVDEATK